MEKETVGNLATDAFWSISTETLIRTLNSDPNSGLSDSAAVELLNRVGLNTLAKKDRNSPLWIFINQFKSPILIILLIATMISAFLNDWTDAAIILLIVLASALLSFSEEYNAGKAVSALQSSLKMVTDVLRDGKPLSISSENVVPGDIINLSAGSVIPADGVILESKDFFVNQAVLTGETFPVEKHPTVSAADAGISERNNVVFMGTNVSSGTAKCMVVATGSDTAFGNIAGRLVLKPPSTEFERGIKQLGFLLTEVMFVLVLLIFAFNIYFRRPVFDSLIFSIALAVGLTPQLLPAIININLSKGSQKMAARGVIVRRLESIENFGSIDVLCTDKTGTLTKGAVKLDGALGTDGKPAAEILRLAAISAQLQTGLANQLDKAILNAADEVTLSGIEKIDEIPYDFVRKRMGVMVRDPNGIRLITKGALKNILNICTKMDVDGQVVPLDSALLDAVDQQFTAWSHQGFRVLGVAEKTVPSHDHNLTMADEFEMTFRGFLLFFDPPKEDVSQTIADLAGLGISLKVITGDNANAAGYIASQVGMKDICILTGAELNTMRAEALVQQVERTNVFAEVDPNQKERIILALKKNGHVVGYMGDGINDAPSLHSADVGISVADAVDVAKQAADFVLLKNDLSVLKDGILEGRKTFANTLKYVFMAVSANFGNMFSMAAASLFLPFLPMLPKQILLINFLTDLPEMTIATDNADPAYVERPHRWNISFIKKFMLVFGPLSSLFDIATFIILKRLLHADEKLFHSGWFIESILSATFVVFVLRSCQPFGKSQPSRYMVMMALIVGVVTVLLPYSPLAGLLGFVPLPIGALLIILAISGIYVALAEFVKRIFYRNFSI